MEWKEAAKWIGVLVAAGAISTAIELFIEWRIKTTVTATAQAEVKKEMAKYSASAKAKTSAGVSVSPMKEVIVVSPPKENGYVFTL